MEDEEIKMRAENMKQDPVSGMVYSKWEREERKKPKVVNEEDEGNEEEEDSSKKPLDENILVRRINDTEDKIREELIYYNQMERPAMEEFMLNLYDNQYIRVESAGLTPDELL